MESSRRALDLLRRVAHIRAGSGVLEAEGEGHREVVRLELVNQLIARQDFQRGH